MAPERRDIVNRRLIEAAILGADRTLGVDVTDYSGLPMDVLTSLSIDRIKASGQIS